MDGCIANVGSGEAFGVLKTQLSGLRVSDIGSAAINNRQLLAACPWTRIIAPSERLWHERLRDEIEPCC